MIRRSWASVAIFLARLAAAADKRGLCFVPNANHSSDNNIWVQSGSDLTWYYNYGDRPSPVFSAMSQGNFEFVPMMWGVNADNLNDTSFLDAVKKLIDDGTNISHVLGFNEPDAPADWGGSNVLPEDAAVAWVANFEPLAEMGVKLGLPACTGGLSSMPWLKQFMGNCSELVSDNGRKKNCTWDFLPVHWYDNFEGLASHIGERRAAWPNTSIWITEYAYANQYLKPTQEFFEQTLDYFDKESYIGRYTYFGAFRSDDSNVGANATFLNRDGDLTAIGNQYLGLGDDGVDPDTGKASDNSGAAMERAPATLALVVSILGSTLLGIF